MGFVPGQPRGPDGRFIPTGRGAVRSAKAGIAGAKPKTKPKTARGARGSGVKGLKANFTPYARVNKRSQTAGFNAGTLIPGTHRRVVVGSYARLESTRNKTAVDRAVVKGVKKAFPAGTKRGRAQAYVSKNISISAPLVRGSVKGHQVRLGTSRGAGPTVIVRRGKHKTDPLKSAVGINKYNKRMKSIAEQKANAKAKKRKSRPQRRRAARKKK